MRKSSRLTTLSSTTTALIDIITTGSGNNDDNGSTEGDKEPLEWWIIALAVGASVLFIILVILMICLCRKRKQGKYEGTRSFLYFKRFSRFLNKVECVFRMVISTIGKTHPTLVFLT